MTLYGSVPFLMSSKRTLTGESRTSGVFWLNSAEMWVDVDREGVDHVKVL